jgi:hypothetical protein
VSDKTEAITLTEVILGLNPYILIEAVIKPESERDDEDDDGLRLRARMSPDVVDEPGMLPMMLIGELPAETNPLTSAVRDMLIDYADHPASVARDVLGSLARYVGFPMPEDVA